MALTDNLIAHWSCEDGSGNNLTDDHVNGYTLTQHNTVGSAGGIVGNARQFTAASSMYADHADNADFSVGSSVFAILAWLYFDSTTGNTFAINKGTAGFDAEFYLGHLGVLGLAFSIFKSPATQTVVFGNVDGHGIDLTQTATWYMVFAYYDGSVIGLDVNNGTNTASTAHTTGSNDSTYAFEVGKLGSTYFDGRIDEIAVWKGRVPDASELTTVYNGGLGLAWSSWGGGGGGGVTYPQLEREVRGAGRGMPGRVLAGPWHQAERLERQRERYIARARRDTLRRAA